MSAASPGLRELSRDGFWFERAYSPSTFTVFCMFGLLGGRLPNAYSVEFGNTFAAWPTEPVDGLPVWLSGLGYDTGLAGSPGDPGVHAFREEHLGRGFRVRELGSLQMRPEETTEAALRVWRQLAPDRPRFLFVHYLWIHVPRPVDAYGRAVQETTVALERLVAEIGDRVTWIVVADHGEEFGDHGGTSHGRTLYQEVVHVPLVIRVPDRRGKRVSSVSPTRSLPATAMALVAPDWLPPGRGPYLCLDQADCRDLPVPMALEMQHTHLHGLVLGHLHLVRDLPRGGILAFDLATDPREERPLDPPPSHAVAALETWEDVAIGSRDPESFWPYRPRSQL